MLTKTEAALLDALERVTPGLPPKDASCHGGICEQEKCGYCSGIIHARKAIAMVKAKETDR